jgi:hypothetical protein
MVNGECCPESCTSCNNLVCWDCQNGYNLKNGKCV